MAQLIKGKVKFDKEDNVWGYVRGKAKWAQVLEPGEYGFQVQLFMEPEVQEEFLEKLTTLTDKALEDVEGLGKKATARTEYIKTNDDGEEYFQFKLEAEGYEGKPNHIKIFGKNGKEDKEWDKLIGNGSSIVVKYRAKPYYMTSSKEAGASVRFFAIQVVDLVEYGTGESGFNDETDGVPFEDSNEEY